MPYSRMCLAIFVRIHHTLNRYLKLFVVLSVLLLLLAEWRVWRNELPLPDEQVQMLQSYILQREATLNKSFGEFSNSACPDMQKLEKYPENWKDVLSRQGLSFTGYREGEIIFWTDNSFPVSSVDLFYRDAGNLWKLKNGWYLARRDTFGSCSVLGLALIKTEYSYQNDYLHNHFPFAESLPEEITLKSESEAGADALYSENGRTLGYMIPANSDLINPGAIWPPIDALALLILFICLHLIAVAFVKKQKPLGAFSIFAGMLALRLGIFFWHIPKGIFLLSIFNPSEYAASNWLPTLGDLFFNSLLLLSAIHLSYPFIRRLAGKKSLLPPLLAVSVFYVLSMFIAEVLRGLIINSSISLDIRDVLHLTTSSYFSFGVIAALFTGMFLFINAFTGGFRASNGSFGRFWLIQVIPIAGAISWGSIEDLLFLSAFLPAVMMLSWFALKGRNTLNYAYLIAFIAAFAALGNYLILDNSDKREHERRKLLAVKISAERDPIAESLFLETEQKLLRDSLLKSYLQPGNIPVGQVRDLAQLFFNGYWEKYSISVNVFGADECPMTALYTPTVKDPLAFDHLIDSVGIPTLSDHFFFLDDGSGRISYMARLPVFPKEGGIFPLGTLYIEFQSRYTPEEIGYPELLLDKMVQTRTDLSAYSYARYNGGKLVSHYGSYPYELHDSLFAAKAADEFSFIKTGDFDHLIYKPNSESLVVLSKPLEGVLFVLTPFSYLILFFSLLAVIPFGVARLMKEKNPVQLSFKRRIQLSIVLLLFASLILIGGGTIIYIISNSNQKNLNNISERIHSLLIETEYILGKEPALNPATAGDVAYSLTRQANVFFSDINLYSPNGYLYASSRSKIFEEGLVSKIMHPEAYFNLVVRQSSEFIHQESIGTLEYASAYVPLRNNENRVIGYLNLPYFARQDELRQEIATFVVAIVNIYVLLIVLVVITAIFLSNTITAPLQLIRERLGQIRLGRKNEMIEWSGNDEIADLIAEYNRMVNELADSADKLARSERETAWREMAKQVAHEIKNPLTPMKLSTQMLRRAWDDKAEGFDQRLDRFTKNLIEQIDTLSHIATEFSNFAKMPKMHLEQVNMLELLQNVTDFHQGENGVSIQLNAENVAGCKVMTDKEQMLRVFNNLLRNAMQAIPDDREGKIRIELRNRENECFIEVHDNGSGIPEELRDKIFSPNFTTKNAGMGLGLALVKNIIESSGGKVWFESEPGTGTVFYISLPLAADV